jgi:hypothetical protein
MDSTSTRIPSKQIQTKPSKKAWISLDLLGFIRPNRDFSKGYERRNKKKSNSRLKLCAERLIGSPLDSPPSSWSTRRHFRVANSRDVRHAPESAVDFAPLRLGPRRGGKTGNSEGFLSPSETNGFATLAVSP